MSGSTSGRVWSVPGQGPGAGSAHADSLAAGLVWAGSPSRTSGTAVGPAGAGPAAAPAWTGALRGAGRLTDPATPQYPVLLLNEDQIAQLLHRHAMRTIDARLGTGVSFGVYARLMRRTRIITTVMLLISAGAAAWIWAPLPVAAFPWAGTGRPPAIATGASFSLTVASPRGAAAAHDLARRLAAAGTPSFVRTDGSSSYVMAGPYVSLDEAEMEQRRLARAGLAATRMFVDDSLLKAAGERRAIVPPGRPSMVLVGAAHQLSLVFEFEEEPQQVTTKRSADGTVLVEMGPVAGVVAQEWSAPDGIDLLRQVKVEEIVGSSAARHARATLALPRSTTAQARVEGRRVYVDLAPAPRVVAGADAGHTRVAASDDGRPAVRRAAPVSAAPTAAAAAVPPAAAAVGGDPVPVGAARPATGPSLAPVLARFERLIPFLQSATGSPGSDVLRAVASSVDEVDAALRQVPPTAETADAHAALTSALAAAKRAVDAAFTGDRTAEAHQAAMFVEAAKSVLPVAAP